MYKIIKSKHNKTALIAVVLGIITMGFILLVGTTNAFFHENESAKPELQITNPIILGIFDDLYAKHPNIIQDDVDKAHAELSTECVIGIDAEGDSTESALGAMMTLSFCQGFAHGMLTDYLDALGITYYSPEDKRIPPTLTE